MDTSKLKLTYFNFKGRGEHIRWLLALANADYEDHRIDTSSWPSLKDKTPTKALPVLEVDGKAIGQSGAMALYIAGEYGLLGSNRFEAALCHMVWDTVNDFIDDWLKAIYCKEEDRKDLLLKDFNEKAIPKMVSIIKPLLGEGRQWLVGDKVSLADVVVAYCLSDFTAKADWMEIDPELKALALRVRELPEIKKWLETRPPYS